MLQSSIIKVSFKITFVNFHPNLPGVNELNTYDYEYIDNVRRREVTWAHSFLFVPM